MRVAIVGSRDFPDLKKVRDYIVSSVGGLDTIVTGGARGVDTAARTFGEQLGIRVLVIPPPGPAAGYDARAYAQNCIVRNRWIAAECDRLVAFWDGESRGTAATRPRSRMRSATTT